MIPIESGQHLNKEFIRQNEFSITMVGHATLLLNFGGTFILTDPVLNEKVLPITPFNLGRRYLPPGLEIGEFPLDAIVISHRDGDHFNRPSLHEFAQSKNIIVICHRPLARDLQHIGFSDVRPLPVWENTQVDDVIITAVPAWHRGKDKGIGFVIQNNNKSIYFAGDTGLFPEFEEIGQRFHPQIALLPIGEYPPLLLRIVKEMNLKGIPIPKLLFDYLDKYEEYKRKFVHMSPWEIPQAIEQLSCELVIPIHHSVFDLGGHMDINEPVELMRQIINENQLEDRIKFLAPGDTMSF